MSSSRYNGTPLRKREDLKAVPEPAQPVPSRSGARAGRPARARPRQARRGDRSPAGTGRDRRAAQAPAGARGGPVGRRGLRPLARHAVRGRGARPALPGRHRPARILLGADASEPELDRLAASGELGRFGFIHLATHGVIDEAIPVRTAVILTQTGLPDPLEQALTTGRSSTAGSGPRDPARLGPEGRAGHALGLRDRPGPRCRRRGLRRVHPGAVDVGTRSVCLSLWKVDDTATALLMQRFYANLLGRRAGLTGPLPKAEALREAKAWLRGLRPVGGAGGDRRRSRAASIAAREPRAASRASAAPRSPPAETTTVPMPRRTTGPPSSWPATRIDRLPSPE